MSLYQSFARPAFIVALLVLVATASNVHICNDFAEVIYLSWDAHPGMYVPKDTVLYNTQCTSEDFAPGWGGAVYIGLVPNTNDASVGDWRTHDTKVEFCVGGFKGFDWFVSYSGRKHHLTTPSVVAGESPPSSLTSLACDRTLIRSAERLYQ